MPQAARGAGLVLIVDDAPDVRDLYMLHLTHRGFSVVSAADGHAAIDVARAAEPDVIVMDLSMPHLDGVSAIARLKQHPRTRNIPVVVLTGYALKDVERAVLEAGADVFLAKPCLPEHLEHHVRALVERRPDTTERPR